MSPTDRPELGSFHAVSTALTVLVVAVVVLTVEELAVAVALALVALYVLHLLSLRRILNAQQEQWETFRGILEDLRRELDARGAGDLPPDSGARAAGEELPAERLRETLWRGGAPAPAGAGSGGAATSREGAGAGGPGGGSAEASASAAGAPAAQGPAAEAAEDVVIPRQFALGTVALIRKKMEPGEIARVLERQRERPDQFFGELAVELGYLDEGELDELLRDQRQGLFRDAEIRDARERLQRYRERTDAGDAEGG